MHSVIVTANWNLMAGRQSSHNMERYHVTLQPYEQAFTLHVHTYGQLSKFDVKCNVLVCVRNTTPQGMLQEKDNHLRGGLRSYKSMLGSVSFLVHHSNRPQVTVGS